MTPQEFIAKWRAVELKERSASHSHFNDLCRLLGLDDPTTADGKGEWFMFDKGLIKDSGGDGWADVWRRGCFAWEYKGRHANLDRLLPKDAAAAAELKKRTLTNLYNARPAWLLNLHKALDAAVADAYGWGDDWRAGRLTDDDILARLFGLNQARAAVQGG